MYPDTHALDVNFLIQTQIAMQAGCPFSSNTTDILSLATVRIPIKRNAAAPDVVEFRALVDECSDWYRPNDNQRRRVRGQLRTQSPLFSSIVNCILETKHFKSSVGWFLNKPNIMIQTGCVSVNGNAGICFPANQTTGEHSIEIVFFSGNNAFITPGLGTAGIHFAQTGSGNNNNTCATFHP